MGDHRDDRTIKEILEDEERDRAIEMAEQETEIFR